MARNWMPPRHNDPHEVPIELEEGNCGSYQRSRPQRDLFWPPDSDQKRPGPSMLKAANRAWEEYCHDCPVLLICLRHSLEEEEYGVWAGTTDYHRRLARKEMNDPRADPELMEYMTNRAKAGYIPFPLPVCSIKSCKRVVANAGEICGYHKGQLKRKERS